MNVLILEDESEFAHDLKAQVEGLGHHVMGPATDCSAALELIWRETPDLAILDTHLGSETCEVVMEECERQSIPVIIATGEAVQKRPAFIGSRPLLAKPYVVPQVTEALGVYSLR